MKSIKNGSTQTNGRGNLFKDKDGKRDKALGRVVRKSVNVNPALVFRFPSDARRFSLVTPYKIKK